jgi:hypothetical protein
VSVCPFICRREKMRHPPDRFSWNLMYGSFIRTCDTVIMVTVTDSMGRSNYIYVFVLWSGGSIRYNVRSGAWTKNWQSKHLAFYETNWLKEIEYLAIYEIITGSKTHRHLRQKYKKIRRFCIYELNTRNKVDPNRPEEHTHALMHARLHGNKMKFVLYQHYVMQRENW